MKQIFHTLGNGEISISEFPAPVAGRGRLLIRSNASVVSAGTERSMVEFGKAGLIEKARQRPEKVLRTLEKVRTDGVLATVAAVRDKLEDRIIMGYSNAGVVVEVGAGVDDFSPGDRVVSNGPHAELVCVPRNLCARIPEGVSDEAAGFTVLGAVAVQGIRLVQPTIGECFVVIGLGLIGLFTVQVLLANGCRVMGVDRDPERLDLARRFGAMGVDISKNEDPVRAALSFSDGRGVDGVLVTAHTTSNEPIHQAAMMCRKRGRIVLVGQTGLHLSRDDFYEKELTFQVSCSYGPGRYDPFFEQQGHDYPFGFVRWTEQRNFEAVLSLIRDGKIDVEPIITHRFPFERALEAYEILERGESSLGIVLQYPSEDEQTTERLLIRTVSTRAGRTASRPQKVSSAQTRISPVVGVIGTGDHAVGVILPALRKNKVRLKTVASQGGFTASRAARKFGFEQTTTDVQGLMSDPEINTVFVLTRHDTHASYVNEALRAGKHVFVEKPLAINPGELAEVEEVYSSLIAAGTSPLLMVGFNRRFSPHIVKIKELIDPLVEPKSFIMTVNAGEIPSDHWTQDPEIGGGRIIGEACHFVDLLRYLAGSAVVSANVTSMGMVPGGGVTHDKMTFTLSFSDGSFGTIHYLANGHKSFPKERLEVFCAGGILQLDNFRTLVGYGWPGFKSMRLWRQDKGHLPCVTGFLDSVRQEKPAAVTFEELVEVTRVTFSVVDAAAGGLPQVGV